jgi:hypothetical protein
MHGIGSVEVAIELKRNKQRGLGSCGKRLGRESSLPGVESDGGYTFTSAER